MMSIYITRTIRYCVPCSTCTCTWEGVLQLYRWVHKSSVPTGNKSHAHIHTYTVPVVMWSRTATSLMVMLPWVSHFLSTMSARMSLMRMSSRGDMASPALLTLLIGLRQLDCNLQNCFQNCTPLIVYMHVRTCISVPQEEKMRMMLRYHNYIVYLYVCTLLTISLMETSLNTFLDMSWSSLHIEYILRCMLVQ